MKYLIPLACLTLVLGACRNSPPEPESRQAEARSGQNSAQVKNRPEGQAPQQTEDQVPNQDEQPRPAPGPPPEVTNPAKWNYPAVAWSTNQAGRQRMKDLKRPGLVVLQGDWCPHCRSLATVFADPEIKKLSHSFELILLDSDSAEAEQYDGTGKYVPRTLFLRPDGTIDTSLTVDDRRFPHFFSVRHKADLVQAMKTAISRYGS